MAKKHKSRGRKKKNRTRKVNDIKKSVPKVVPSAIEVAQTKSFGKGKTLAGIIALTIGAIGLGSLYSANTATSLESSIDKTEYVSSVASEQKIEVKEELPQIGYEYAQKIPELRDLYVSQLLARKEVSNEYWQFFDKLVYEQDNPDSESRDNKRKKFDNSMANVANAPLMSTPKLARKNQEKSTCHIYPQSFELLKTEEEFFSAIDHESFHAYMFRGFFIPQGASLEGEMSLLLAESLAYHYQLKQIRIGKRETSKNTIKMWKKIIQELYDKSARYAANYKDGKGLTGTIICTNLENSPEFKFFGLKRR